MRFGAIGTLKGEILACKNAPFLMQKLHHKDDHTLGAGSVGVKLKVLPRIEDRRCPAPSMLGLRASATHCQRKRSLVCHFCWAFNCIDENACPELVRNS